jgi:hypothetical protein
MRKVLHLAAAMLFMTGAAATRAQVFDPNNLIPQPPKSPVHQTPKPFDDMQWLWQYTKPAPGGQASNLRLDARFQTMLRENFKQPQSMWGPTDSREPLATVIPLFLDRYGAVYAEDNRYITVDGCVPNFCSAEGLLWIDLGRREPLAVFAAVNWTTEGRPVNDPAANYNLWLFSNRNLSADALPLECTAGCGASHGAACSACTACGTGRPAHCTRPATHWSEHHRPASRHTDTTIS